MLFIAYFSFGFQEPVFRVPARPLARFVCFVDVVRDGDTFHCVENEVQRSVPAIAAPAEWLGVAGIDAPEREGDQPGWRYAMEHLDSLLRGQTVRAYVVGVRPDGVRLVQVEADCGDVALRMVTDGAAWYWGPFVGLVDREVEQQYKSAFVGMTLNSSTAQGLWIAFLPPIRPEWWRRGVR